MNSVSMNSVSQNTATTIWSSPLPKDGGLFDELEQELQGYRQNGGESVISSNDWAHRRH